MSYKSRQQSDSITRDCFNQSDMDRSGTITIYEFYSFLQIVYQRLGIYRQVNQQQCEQLFRFYDDDRNGFLTPNQLVDIVWDLYTADVQNDRVAIQQMLEKIIIEKYYNRPYNQFDTSNLYGHWGQANTKGDWRNYRFNPYQMHKMQKFGYQFQRPTNNFQNIGMSSDFSQGGYQQGGFGQQQQGGFVQQGGFGQQQGGFVQQQGGFGQQQQVSSLGNYGQQGTYGGQGGFGGQGSFGEGQVAQGGRSGHGLFGSNVPQTGTTVVQVGNTVVVVGGGNTGGMGMQNGMQMGGMGMNNGMQMGQMQMGGNMSMNQSMGMGMNQNMGGQRSFHTTNTNSQWGQQQMQVDPFCWNQIPSFGNDPQHIVLPSPSQLGEQEKMIDLNTFGQLTTYIQAQEIALVTPIRSRQLTQYQCFEAVKQLPYLLQNKGYNGQIHFKIYFSEFVNLLEQNQFKW